MAELSGSAHFGWTELVFHVIWMDSITDGAGEQENLLYRWIPTVTEQENKRTCCTGGFQQ